MATQDVRVKFTGDPSDLKRATAEARAAVDAVTKRVNAQKAAMAELRKSVSGLASAYLGIAIAQRVRELAAYGGQIDDVAGRLGESTETVQRFGYATNQTGSSLEGFIKSMKKVTANAAAARDGNKELSDQFEALGINAAEFVNLSLEEKTKLLSKGLSDAQGNGDRLNDAMKLLGKTGDELLPMLSNGPEELSRLLGDATVMSDETIKSLADLDDRLVGMGDTIRAQLGTAIVEASDNWSDFFAAVGAGVEAAKSGTDIGSAMTQALVQSSGDREQDATARRAKRDNRARLNEAAANADKEPPVPAPTADNTAADKEKKTAEEIADLAFETARIRHQDRRDGMSDAEKIKDLTKDRLHLEQEIAKQSDPLKKAQMEKSLAELDSEINRIERSVNTVVEPTGGSGGGGSSAAPDAPAIDESMTPQEREHQAYVEQMRKGGRLPNPGIERRLRRDAQKSRMRADRWNERGIGGPSGEGNIDTAAGYLWESNKKQSDYKKNGIPKPGATGFIGPLPPVLDKASLMGDGSNPSSAPNKTEDRLAAIEKAVSNLDRNVSERLPSKSTE